MQSSLLKRLRFCRASKDNLGIAYIERQQREISNENRFDLNSSRPKWAVPRIGIDSRDFH